MNKTYTTSEIASKVGVHVNTVRFYEKIGILTKPNRLPNGYRVYTQLHLDECILIRLAMRAEVLQNGLRNKAFEIIRLCAELKFDQSYNAANKYCQMIDDEIKRAEDAIKTVNDILKEKESQCNSICFSRKEAAKEIDITTETLRTWERNGLLKGRRLANGYRIYEYDDIRKLNIIRTLRCANYSLASILRLFNKLNRNNEASVEAALNIPDDDEDIISVCDRLIVSLKNTKKDALCILSLVKEISEKNYTLQ